MAKTKTKPSLKSLFLKVVLAPKLAMDEKCTQPRQTLGKLGSKSFQYQLKELVASDPEKNTPHHEAI